MPTWCMEFGPEKAEMVACTSQFTGDALVDPLRLESGGLFRLVVTSHDYCSGGTFKFPIREASYRVWIPPNSSPVGKIPWEIVEILFTRRL